MAPKSPQAKARAAARLKAWLKRPGNRDRYAASKLAWQRAQDPNIRRQQQAEHRWRGHELTRQDRRAESARIRTGLFVVGLKQLRNPRFTWMDTNGDLHEEMLEGVEQFIRRLQKEGKIP